MQKNRRARKLLHLPVSVWLKYDHVARRIVVRKVLWSGREYSVRQRGSSFRDRRSKFRRRLYHCATDGGMAFVLAQDCDTQRWTLVEARNFVGDPIE